MQPQRQLSIQLVAASTFEPPAGLGWWPSSGAATADAVVEFAGRASYDSFGDNESHTSSTDAFLHHIIDAGNLSLLEHASVTLYIQGISMATSHEILRHRDFSVSELSQYSLPEEQRGVVVPSVVQRDEQLQRFFEHAIEDAAFVHDELHNAVEASLTDEKNVLLRKQQVREAAMALAPAARETRLVVSGNLRTWRNFVATRAAEHSGEELRAVAVRCLELLSECAPVLFEDFVVTTLPDGTKKATTQYKT
ncbi:FAD-dependent thymidylate synthase [Corynebacterium sp. HMSC08D02]|nr:FAD-dependent thymidylate synthase [Corynebacterium sp. HMSC08D02]